MLDPDPDRKESGGDRSGRLLQLDPGDNIAVATADLRQGAVVAVGDREIRLERDVPTGHKVAIRAIAAGEKVVKYRVPIGSAITAIRPGDYVHIHNLKSDYIATYTLGDGEERLA
jgi:hypothetical protein